MPTAPRASAASCRVENPPGSAGPIELEVAMSQTNSDVQHSPEHTMTDDPVAVVSPTRQLRTWQLFLIGVGSAALGLLPWLITGMRLPLQNLWASETLPDDMPLVLLPFSQYSLSLIASLVIIGAAIAGLVGRATRAWTHRGGFALLLAGVLLVDAVAIGQTATAVGGGLRDDDWSVLYLWAVVAVAILAVIVGVGVLWLIARAPRAGAVIGFTIAAILSAGWLHALLSPQGPAFAGEPAWLWAAVRWVPAVLVGAAIAWGGIDTVGRIVAAIASLVMLWVGPTLITAVSAAAGTRVLAKYPGEMVDYGVGVFRMALTDPGLVVAPLVMAIVVAAIGLVARTLIGRSAAARREASAA
ncbi:hypothetical protein [Agromyces badenianii]|uniref:hypothetical protein n=1 Tax=Agromyces badenianii TaxID=2080742 RepID=UPI0011B21B7C|nr:hypothetical protein [Agromyces badenianii]